MAVRDETRMLLESMNRLFEDKSTKQVIDRAETGVFAEDLWRAVDSAVSKHRVEWRWLKGHAGHAGNERCDQLANEEMAKIRSQNCDKALKTGRFVRA